MSTAGSDQEADDIAVLRIHASESDGNGAEIIFEFNGKNISVSAFASRTSPDHPPPDMVEDHLIKLLGQAVMGESDEEHEEILDEILDIILGAGKTQFSQIAPPHASSDSTRDPHSLLYPETFNFRFQTIGGKASMLKITAEETYTDPEPQSDHGFDSNFQIDSELPQYSSKEILVLESFVGSGTVSRVKVDCEEMLCKARRMGLNDQNLDQELVCLQKIKEANRSSIRVPRLLGYVKHAETGNIVGLLRQWAPSGLRGGLRDVEVSSISRERRQKWARQIRETVDQLHDIGVVWGDGKADNIIFDENDDACLIDFGCGWTYGWVDEKLADTLEGDEQAVQKILEVLAVDNSV